MTHIDAGPNFVKAPLLVKNICERMIGATGGDAEVSPAELGSDLEQIDRLAHQMMDWLGLAHLAIL